MSVLLLPDTGAGTKVRHAQTIPIYKTYQTHNTSTKYKKKKHKLVFDTINTGILAKSAKLSPDATTV